MCIRDRISGEDLSNVRFAFGTYEKYIGNGGSGGVNDYTKNGNCFTIDMSGNTHIYGNLIVDGSQVIFRTEFFDVSDANITLNTNNGSPEGGGLTIIDTINNNGNKGLLWKSQNGPGGSTNYWDTSGSDTVSYTHLTLPTILLV